MQTFLWFSKVSWIELRNYISFKIQSSSKYFHRFVTSNIHNPILVQVFFVTYRSHIYTTFLKVSMAKLLKALVLILWRNFFRFKSWRRDFFLLEIRLFFERKKMILKLILYQKRICKKNTWIIWNSGLSGNHNFFSLLN